jgi:hypothetical protein
MTSHISQSVFIEPPSAHYLGDQFFNLDNLALNRDGGLQPFARLREEMQARGIAVRTADALRRGESVSTLNHYWSFGMLNEYSSLLVREDVRLRGFFLLEPPLTAPHLYKALPELTRHFERVYVHNTQGDGYSLRGVDRSKLAKVYFPQPFDRELEPYWDREQRANKLVVIAGHHHAKFRRPELYSERIKAVASLVDDDAIDLFGRGWDQWWTKESLWWPYWRNYRALMRAYRGSCVSKHEVLSRYRFSLCYENMPMTGYLTEKLFDCLYAGTVPVYLGAPDIASLVPPEAYVDMRQFPDTKTMFAAIKNMPSATWRHMREAGREFLRGAGKSLYCDAVLNACFVEVSV